MADPATQTSVAQALAPIPFNRPSVSGKEYDYIKQAIDNGHISGDGPFTKKCHRILQDALGVDKVLLTTSCTDALELSALLLNIQPGDEVIVPSFTFVSTVNAFVLRGARPVFADIRADTLNIDETQIERLITHRTKAIVPVHYAGVGCEMDTLMDIAARRAVTVVEDNAHGLFGKYRGQSLGTFGELATLSFHETKNISCGEGGALLINDEKFVDRAEILREKGTNRSRFFRGQVDKYTWVETGSSFLPSDILAAFLCAQLEAREIIQRERCRIWNYYARHLDEWARQQEVRLPHVPSHCEQAYHMFYLLMPSRTARDRLINYLKEHDVMSVFHYLPLHLSEMGKRCAAIPTECPITEHFSERLVRLPFFNQLTEPDQNRIVTLIRQFHA